MAVIKEDTRSSDYAVARMSWQPTRGVDVTDGANREALILRDIMP